MSGKSLAVPTLGNASMGGSIKSLKGAGSFVDTNMFLLRLAGKKTEDKQANNEKLKNGKSRQSIDKTKEKTKPSHKKSLGKDQLLGDCQLTTNPVKFEEHDPLSFEVTDWYEEMDETTLGTFRDLFNMLDQSNTGIITVDNLYEELQRVDSEITYSEVEDVLKKVDKDGNGEIDFDEFLYHMTRMGGELFGEDGDAVSEDQKRKFTRRKRLFYSAITQFSIKQTLADIEKTFRKQAPHVISHYTAGVRLIGLTQRQLERQMKRMQKTAGQNDSPYAKPLQFVHMGAKKRITHRKKIKSPGLLKDKPVMSNRDLDQAKQVKEEIHDTEGDTTVENLSQEISNTMRLLAQQRGSIVSKLQDANLIMQLRQKIGKVKACMQTKDLLTVMETAEESDTSSGESSPDQVSKKTNNMPWQQKNYCSNKTKPKSKQSTKKVMQGLGWTTPRIQYMEVPLPSMKMKLKSDKPTFNDLHRIRAKANEAIDSYYHNLRQTEIRNAWDHWDRLYADVILPKKLLENFRTVYSAYSPHREEEAFVLCPWKPGPFRYIRHMPKVSNRSLPNSPGSPGFLMGRTVGSIKKTHDLIVRPLSSPSSINSSQFKLDSF